MPEITTKKGIDPRINAPSIAASSFSDSQFWKRNLTNNDFLAQYRRNGLAQKAIDKRVEDVFDKLFDSENEQMLQAIREFKLNEINRYALKNVEISGFCLIFIGYADNKDYSQPIQGSPRVDYFYVIPRAWIKEDKFTRSKEIRDYYEIYTKDGGTFNLHESRVIRFNSDPDETSKIEAAWNALWVCDHILWTTGQSMFRYGTGFPHLKIDQPITVTDSSGNAKSEVQIVKEGGAVRDLTTQTGFVSDSRYSIDFVGANGTALDPMKYWDVAFTNVAIGLKFPKAFFEGAQAGSISGSDFNIKDYHGDLSALQTNVLQPLYEQQMELLGVSFDSEKDFMWVPLSEMSVADITDNFSKDSASFDRLVSLGVMSVEEARSTLKRKYEWLMIEGQGADSAPTPKKKVFINEKRAEDAKLPKARYKKKTKLTSQSKGAEKVEKSFLRRYKKKFLATEQIISGILQGFNTDSEDYDIDDLDEVFKKYHSLVNMGYSELKAWSENPCSKLASQTRGPINRNLELLNTKKDDWTSKHVGWANKTIAFISRMREVSRGEEQKHPSTGKTCPSDRDVSLKNWAFNPNKSSDALDDNFVPITTRIGRIMANEKDVYRDIVQRFIEEAFEEGLIEAGEEVELDVQRAMARSSKSKRALTDNATKLAVTLVDNVEKDLTLFLTNTILNEVPFTNSGLKAEVQRIFQKRFSQLESQVVTETTRAFNSGLEFGFKESGLVTHKIWQSVIDDRTTQICQHLNGEIVEIGQPFSTGDFNAPAHINCRSKVAPLTLSEQELEQFKQ